MVQIKCYIRTADKTRKAEIGISPEVSIRDIIETSIEKWNLPEGASYQLVNVSQNNKILSEDSLLSEIGLQEGDVLELQPILEAGL